ncbi:tetratricopeptide repeat protein [Gemmata sp. JC717]|uniref:tetratricopeptide repeat protein n=1 Tax=Gemmata algarum TaxID=2975278 RepID=UPI0021BB0045|nr:tetratricopeptide repeat protein [Gemmata algarum]MDY3553586.1 tetratricopeptide repeat protein [Gemmata algarum]
MPTDQSTDASRAAGSALDPGPSNAADSTQMRTHPSGNGSAPPPGLISVPGYQLTRLIARGGMGAVYAARDPVLDRDVAVKTLLPGADPARFVTEARITGRLTHPNIPPVYALGALPSGGHFLAMKLVHGHTLAELLANRVAPADARGRPAAPPDLPRLVQVFDQIAQAVGFAHSRGVLHRDLKPLNVMVGEFGEVQVMDWGLAKDQAAADAPATGEETTPDAPERTRIGQVMGTPGYMAPEQARGEAVDARADVFALGAVLAVILTGRPAFVGASAHETIDKAATADLADVLTRLTACGADAELVALARRCLEADPAARPADARAVAAEVSQYRASVEARLRQAEADRTRAETQAAEQRKRRRVVQRAGAAVAAVLLLGMVGTAVGLVEARRQAARAGAEAAAKEEARLLAVHREREAKQARDREAEQRRAAVRAREQEAAARAVAERAETRSANVLDAMVSELAGASLATQHAISAEQKAFLAQVLPYYREFGASRGGDAKTRGRVALAAFRLGAIEYRLGRLTEGVAAFESARDGYAKLAAEFPAAPDYRVSLAGSLNNLGNVLKDLGRHPAAEEQYRRAIAVQENLGAEFPTVPTYRLDLARSRNNLGILLASLGRRPAAEEQYRQAVAIQEKLTAEFPAVPTYRVDLARIRNNLGNLLKDLDRPPGAEEQYRQAVAIQEKLVAEFPAAPDYRLDLARSRDNLGNLLKDLGRPPGAEEQYRQAVAIQEKLAADFPAVPAYRVDLARIRNNLGNLLKDLGRSPGAEEQYRQAVAIRAKLAADFPAVIDYRVQLGGSYYDLGTVLSNGDPKGSLDWFGRAIECLQSARKQEPHNATAQKLLWCSHWGRAGAHDRLQKFAEAIADWDRAIALSPPAQQPGLRASRAASRLNAGRHAEAVAEVAELTKRPDWSARHWYDFARVYSVASGTIADKKADYSDRAVELLRSAVKAGYTNAASMKADTALGGLRHRADFQALVADLEDKLPPTLPTAPPPHEMKQPRPGR